MGRSFIIWLAQGVLLCATVLGTPYSDQSSFLRSAVETIPEHEPIAVPIRASVESVPHRSLAEESEMRLPLRDAVEKRPITILDKENLLKTFQENEEPSSDLIGLREYFGAATYLNSDKRHDERLHLGNANLQEMQQTSGNMDTRRMVVCYVESRAAYRAQPLAFTASLLPRSCTHLHYAFAVLHPHTYTVIPANEDYDIIKGGYRIATGLKSRLPGLRVLLSIGGDGTDRLFSEMVQKPKTRMAFVNSAVDFLREHDFDGAELHWTFPGEKDENEKELLTSLLYELREKFSSYGFLLSVVLPPLRYQLEDGIDLSAVSGAADYAVLQAWDMAGRRDEPPSKAVQHSPLYRDPGAASRDQRYDNIEFVVKYILRHGMVAEKLVLGIPLFGRSYTLATPSQTEPGSMVIGWGKEGQYTQTKGLLAYFEICMAEREGRAVVGTDAAGNSYAILGNQWISYDTPSSVSEKMKFVISMGLAGAAAWAVDMDDYRGLCGSPFPILSTISSNLNSQMITSEHSTLKIGSCDSTDTYLASDEQSCAHFHFCTGGINYRIVCEDDKLYDPSTGYCGHQDVARCIPGQSLRLSIGDTSASVPVALDNSYEWNEQPEKETISTREETPARYVLSPTDVKRTSSDFQNKIVEKLHWSDAHNYSSLSSRLTNKHSSEVKDLSSAFFQDCIKRKRNYVKGADKENDKRVVCYMTSWAFYRRADAKFVPEQIDTRLCTHVIYAYASLTPDELVAKEFDPWTDITNNLYERVTSLKDVKVLLGLGGWTDSAGDKYSRLVSSASARTKFVVKLVSFLRMHHFQGLHLDWNYPVCWQSNCKKGAMSDKANFAKLVQELSKALHNAGMELGVAVSGYKEVIDSAYDLASLSKSADFLSAMTYDYHGGWERNTAHHTPISPAPMDSLPYYSIEYAIKSLISGGADPKKLNLGLSFYGQTYRLADVEVPSRPGAPAAGPGEPGEFTKQPGMLAYYEICYRVTSLRWKVGRQDKAGPYAYSDSQWVGYDDPKSITEKVEWALRQGLGGVTAWAIDLDDFNNKCCNEPWPLLRAAGRALGRSTPAPPTAACDRPPAPSTPAPPTTTTVASDGSIGGAAPDHSGHGDHGGHGDHSSHTTTTWPNWMPAATTISTAQTWWPQSTTTTKPTTTAAVTTTTRRATTSTTTLRPTLAPARPVKPEIPGQPCVPGEFTAAPSDCGSYLQCEGGKWLMHRCAPGLHWSASGKRCDWPNFAMCIERPSMESSAATSTLAPMTSRPPPPSTTTTRRTTTTSSTTTTTTTTTRRPTTAAAPAITSGDSMEGKPCNGESYSYVVGDCNAYLHCDGDSWRLQKCAPGLHWNANEKHCDWPKFAKCKMTAVVSKPTTSAPLPQPTRPEKPPTISVEQSEEMAKEGGVCGAGDSHESADTCDAYLLCVSGRWRKQLCPPSLHWDKKTNRCDWVEFAMCQEKSEAVKVEFTTKKPISTNPTTSRRPISENIEESLKPGKPCVAGTYHTHPRCEKFFVCVNGILVTQSCPPGLVWRREKSQCDFPRSGDCSDQRQVTSAAIVDASMPLQDDSSTFCQNGEYATLDSDCSRYKHCIFGKFEEFSCAAGLHWNQKNLICDWPKEAKCKKSGNPATSVSFFPDPIVNPPSDSSVESAEEHKPIQSPSNSINTASPSEENDINAKPKKSSYKLVCYYTNWSWYRPGIGKYSPEDIDPTLCTHIVYGFAILGQDGLITAHDSWADYDNRFYERVVTYKRHGIKVSLALGGWNDSAGDKYSKLVNNPAARLRFVEHAVEFLEKYEFDGLDLDWEYPKCWQVDCSKGPDSDKEGFSDLVRELSAALKPKNLLLSAAVSPNKIVIDAAYDVPVLARHLDWIAVMTYDYHGQWDKKTGHVAPLYYHPDDDNTYFNVNYTINYWKEKGAPSKKLVMGMPLYGQTFTIGQEESSNGKISETGSELNTPVIAGGDPGEYTRAKGFLAYYEICERIKHRGWKVVNDPYKRMGPYAFKENQWVSYDDIEIIKEKTNFIKYHKLGGGMVWALDLDDFRNRCGQGKHPLLREIKNGLMNPSLHRPSPVLAPSHPIDEDLVDIEFKPSKRPATTPNRPMKQTTPKPVVNTTKKPINTIVHSPEEKFKVVCYYSNWAYYRTGSGKYTPQDIDPSLCTHIVYAFAVLDADELVIKPHDTWLDVDNKYYEKLTAFKKKGVKVVLGLGGWNDSAGDKYSRLVNQPSAIRKFVVHAIDFIEEYGFDGLDLDWEYPKCWQVDCDKGPYSDKQGFGNLVKELRAAFDRRGLLLSAAVSASKRVIDAGYDVPVLSKNLDWIALMTYDYHGHWDKKTGHVSPMYADERDNDQTFNTNFTVNYWIDKGAARNKLIMGLPFYGQSFALDTDENGIGSPTYAGGEAGDETRARGFLSFYEICERIRIQGWKVTRDPGGRSGPYATLNNQWVSFDDDYMARHKAEYVRAMGLGGSMVWAMDLDDFTGKYCGCGKYPLLTTINHVLRDRKMPPPCPLNELSGPMIPSTAVMKPVESATEPQDTSIAEMGPDTQKNDESYDGENCSSGFRADEHDCSKYYLCIGGRYMPLKCPAPLLWNRNHCDMPENSNCKSKAQLRLPFKENENQYENKKIIACYFTNWAYYRRGNSSFGPEQVDASLCTHVVYAWAHLDDNSFKMVEGNPELDIDNDFYGKIVDLRHNGIKVILGIGGLEDSESDKWMKMISDPELRKKFVGETLQYLLRWSFDGLQIAWQYPVCKQAPCPEDINVEEKDNYSALLLELSSHLHRHNKELSAMVSANPEVALLAYDNNILSAAVDWVLIAANDYYASASGKTTYLVLLENSDDPYANSFNMTLAYWTSVLPARQLVIGVPAYSRTYTLRSASLSAPQSPVIGPGLPGPYTNVPGFLAYYEVCSNIKQNNWVETRTERGTYATWDDQWVSYLRPAEVHQVGSSAARLGLGGAGLWALDLDDWQGTCSCTKQPLLTALRQGMQDPNIPPTLCS